MATREADTPVGAGWAVRPAKHVVVLAIALVTIATIFIHETALLRPGDPTLARLATFRWWLIPHVAGGAVALLIAPLQFSSTLRRLYPALHRWAGRLYVVAVTVSACLSLYIVVRFEDQANWWVMGAMGALWLVTTQCAWLAARNRNFVQHQLWIGRSFCLTLTFVATRFVPDLILPGLDYVKMTALYWLFIVLSLVIPDLIVNGRALSLWRARR
jgi:hypothetical protein